MLNLKKTVYRCLIYLVIVAALLPAAMFSSALSVQAASKTEKTPVVPETLRPPSFEQTKGLSNKPYENGQSIQATFMFSGKIADAWANIGDLDSAFPSTIALKNQGDGAWLLFTPPLSKNLKVGERTLEIFAQNISGITSKKFPVTLQQKEIAALPVKYAAGEKDIHLSWLPQKMAVKYLVEWQSSEAKISDYKIVSSNANNSVVISGLQPGTRYEIKIQALDKAGEPVAKKILNLTTYGVAPQKQVAGTQIETKKAVIPAIGSGVSTQIPKVAQKPQSKVGESPTPQPSGSPQEESPKEGWNRLLVALAILIIAAGAAIGGYYGYEWYTSKSHDEEPPEHGASKSKSRW